MSLSQQLAEYISACFTGLRLQSHKHEDALREIAQTCRDQDWRLATWNVDQGLQIPGSDRRQGHQNPIRRPRGVLLLGVPGTGKSAFSKALGADTGRPIRASRPDCSGPS
jgi:DNA replication protein DnaC